MVFINVGFIMYNGFVTRLICFIDKLALCFIVIFIKYIFYSGNIMLLWWYIHRYR
jgi:hypothetical protein